QFAVWGAEVVTVEPPDGAPLRWALPVVPGSDGGQVSLLWEYVAARKYTLQLDLGDEAARRYLRAVVEQADVLVTDWHPSRLAAAGLEPASLARAAPGLVTVLLS